MKKNKIKRVRASSVPTMLRITASDSTVRFVPTEESKPKRFDMTVYTGGQLVIAGWKFPVVVDLAGLEITDKSRPVLKDHDQKAIVGHTEEVKINDWQLTASGVVSGTGEAAKEVTESSKNGFPWRASIGAIPTRVLFVPKGRTVEANGRQFVGPIYVARQSVLQEASFVALGADDDTSAQVNASQQLETIDMNFEDWATKNGIELDTLDEANLQAMRSLYESQQKAETAEQAPPVTETPPQPVTGTETVTDPDYKYQESGEQQTETTTVTVTKSSNDETVEEVAASAAGVNTHPHENRAIQAMSASIGDFRNDMAAETRRINAIRTICAGKHPEIEARAIQENWSTETCELHVLRDSRPAGPAIHAGDNTPTGKAIEAAICMTAGIPQSAVEASYDDRTMDQATSLNMRGAGLHTLMYEVLRAAGQHVRPGRIDDETIRAAMIADNRLIQAAGGFTTLSLSGILGNVANKTMLSAYNAVATVAERICGTTDVNDFKEVTRFRLTGTGVFEKIGADGELKHADLSEESYTNRIDTYGRLITLTRQMMINDDLGAFLQIPRAIGRMSALALEEAVFTLLLANPDAFFSTGNKNHFTGGTSALGIDSLTKAEQMFLDRTDQGGKPILIQPAILLTPTSLKVKAEQLYSELPLNQVPADNAKEIAVNPHSKKFRPIASPYLNHTALTGNSETAWYLLADPADVSCMEIAFLRGRRTPVIESGTTDFNVLGMYWRGYFDFGVAMQDNRAAVKSKGA